MINYFSETRNPFVENAVQYSLAAAHATFDKNKMESLHKLLLQGSTWFLFFTVANAKHLQTLIF